MVPLDSYFHLSITDDGVYAHLLVKEIPEDLRLSTDQLVSFLHQKGVTYGIDIGMLSELAMDPGRFVGGKIVVAKGKEPVAGQPGSIRFVYQEKNEEQKKRLESDRIDLRDVTKLDNVKKGDLLAEKIPPKPGVPGISVTGAVIQPKPGTEAFFRIGKNVVQNEEQTKLYAAIDGLVSITNRGKINVFPVYEVNGDVDYKVGNIDFNGTVVVRGSVLPGFRIRSNGDIRIIGTVEGAFLEAGGSIEVTEGVVGQNKGKLYAGRNVKCSFVQDAMITAGEDVLVAQSIMHSHIKAGKNVICQSGNGLIVGGIIQAGDRVTARTIGNAMSTQTQIEVGVNPELRNELIELRGRLQTLKDNEDKSEKALNLLNQKAAAGKLEPSKMEMRKKLDLTLKQIRAEINDIRSRMLEIEKTLEGTWQASVEVSGFIYPGTKVVIGRAVRFIKDPIRGGRFVLKDGDISFVPIY